jgi:hypothetical protein
MQLQKQLPAAAGTPLSRCGNTSLAQSRVNGWSLNCAKSVRHRNLMELAAGFARCIPKAFGAPRMRIWQCGLAAVVMPWLLVSPSGAQGPARDGGVGPVGTLGYAEVLGRRINHPVTSGALFPEGANGVGVSSRREFEEDGSRATRNGLIASMPVAENMNLGVGIFSVTRYSAKERDFKRAQPMKDVGERTGSLAAVGFSVRF